MNGLLLRLSGGDRRSLGRANEDAAAVLADPAMLDELFAGLRHDHPLIRMRAEDALEKVSFRRPALLQKYKPTLLGTIADTTQAEVCWHMAEMIPWLALTPAERGKAFAILVGYLGDKSSILRASALQATSDLSRADAKFRPAAVIILRKAIASGTPAMKAWARKLVSALSHLRPSTDGSAATRRG